MHFTNKNMAINKYKRNKSFDCFWVVLVVVLFVHCQPSSCHIVKPHERERVNKGKVCQLNLLKTNSHTTKISFINRSKLRSSLRDSFIKSSKKTLKIMNDEDV